jgi:hypothetical protein
MFPGIGAGEEVYRFVCYIASKELLSYGSKKNSKVFHG